MSPRGSPAMIGAVDDVIVAIADPTRWRLLNTLAARGQGTATTLATEVPVSRPAIVKHLGILDRAGLVRSRRAGREVLYSVRPGRMEETARWMNRVASEWDARLAMIKRIAESAEDDARSSLLR